MSKKAVVYSRVSLEKQVRDGVGLEAQVERCKQYAELQGWEVVATFKDEGLSGKSKAGRVGLEQALQYVKDCKGVLVVYSLSRLSRSVIDTVRMVDDLQDKGDLASVSENIDTAGPTGRFHLNVMSAMNQLEREQVSERTKCAMDYLKSQKKQFSRFAPYGYTYIDGVMVNNKEEQKVISRIARLRESGMKQKDILVTLNLEGIRNRRGKKFTQPAISKILANV